MTVHVPTVSPTVQVQAKASTSDGSSMLDAVKGAFDFHIGGGGDHNRLLSVAEPLIYESAI